MALGSAGRSTIVWHELAEVLAALRDATLDVIVLKGAALAETVYPDLAVRPMCDIDLLVRKADIERAYRVLVGIGCCSSSCLSLEAQQRREHHLAPLRKPGGSGLEVHWTLTPPYTPFEPDLNGLWERAQPVRVAGVPVLRLSAEDLLLHVSLRTASDVPYARRSNKSLRNLCDVDRIVLHYGDVLDWQEVVARAGLWRASRSVYLVLLLARDLLGTAVPDDVLDGLRPDGLDPRLRHWAVERVFSRQDTSQAAGPELLRFWQAGGMPGKLRAFLHKVFPSRETMCAEYSVPVDSNRVYLFYARRAMQLILRNYRLVWRLVRRDPGISGIAEGDSALKRWLESG